MFCFLVIFVYGTNSGQQSIELLPHSTVLAGSNVTLVCTVQNFHNNITNISLYWSRPNYPVNTTKPIVSCGLALSRATVTTDDSTHATVAAVTSGRSAITSSDRAAHSRRGLVVLAVRAVCNDRDLRLVESGQWPKPLREAGRSSGRAQALC